MWAKLITIHNPFNTGDRDIVDIEVPLAGLPVSEIKKSLPEYSDTKWAITVNGGPVKGDYVIQPGAYIACCPVPKKDILRVVAFAALAALLYWATPLLAAALNSGFWGSVAAAAISVAGTYLINAVLPPTAPDVPKIGQDSFNESPTYGWGQLRPTLGQGHPIPILYGTHKVSGQVLSKSVTTTGNQQILNIMMSIGHGPIDSIVDIRANNQPESYFRNITTHTRLGAPDDTLIPGFDEIPTQTLVGVKLTPVFHQFTTAGDAVEQLRVDLVFPRGLYQIWARKGYTLAKSVSIQIEYRLNGTSTWVMQPITTISAATLQPLRRTFYITGLTPGKYDIRVKRTNYEATDQYNVDSCHWDTVTEVIQQNLVYPGLAKYALNALATDQLAGSEPVFSALATRSQVQVYNPYILGYENRAATNPAWAAYDLLHNAEYGGNVPAERIDFDSFLDLANHCDELIDGLPRHTCNLYLDTSADLWRHLMAILQLARAVPVRRGAIYSLIADKPGVPVHLFTTGNIVAGSFRLSYLTTDQRANAIEISHTDAARDFTRQTVAAYSLDYNDSDSGDNKASKRFFGCTNRAEVLRECAFQLNSTKWTTRAIDFSVDIDGLPCQVGDLIYFQHDAPTWSEGGRVVSATANSVTLDKIVDISSGPHSIMIRLDDDTLVERIVTANDSEPSAVLLLDTPLVKLPAKYALYMLGESANYKRIYRVVGLERDSDLTQKVSAVEYIEAIYSDGDYVFEEPLWDPQLQEAVNVSSAELITLQPDGSYLSQANITWMPAHIATGYSWAIWLEDITAETDPVKVGISDILHFVIPTGFLALGHSYKVYVVRYDQGPVDSGQNTDTFTLTGELAPPANVLAFSGAFNPTTRSVLFSWDEVEDLDLSHYEIRKGGTAWENATVIIKHAVDTTDVWYVEEPTIGTVTFRIKAVDNAGGYSLQEATAAVPIDTSTTAVLPPTGLTLTSGSQIDSDGTERVYIRATWDANAEVSDVFSHYDLVLSQTVSGWEVSDITESTQFIWYVPANTSHTVKLRSADDEGGSSSWVSDVIISTKDETPPETVTWVAEPSDIIPAFKTIGLRWVKSSAKDIAGYVIERATASDFGDTEEIAVVQTNYFVDVDLGVNETYYYRIKGIDRSENRSAVWSDTRSTTTLSIGTSDIAANTILANHLSTTEIFTLILQSANYSEESGLEAGYKLDAANNIAKFFDFNIDTANGSIIVRNTGSGDYAELTEGDLKFYYSDGADGFEIYNSIKRLEKGSADNGTVVNIPGRWKEVPNIEVAPKDVKLYDPAYSGQSQYLNTTYEDLEETPAGSGFWRFKTRAELALSGTTATSNWYVSDIVTTIGSSIDATPVFSTLPSTIRISVNYQGTLLPFPHILFSSSVKVYLSIDGLDYLVYHSLDLVGGSIISFSYDRNVNPGTHSLKLKFQFGGLWAGLLIPVTVETNLCQVTITSVAGVTLAEGTVTWSATGV